MKECIGFKDVPDELQTEIADYLNTVQEREGPHTIAVPVIHRQENGEIQWSVNIIHQWDESWFKEQRIIESPKRDFWARIRGLLANY